jgi:hypothetical protein
MADCKHSAAPRIGRDAQRSEIVVNCHVPEPRCLIRQMSKQCIAMELRVSPNGQTYQRRMGLWLNVWDPGDMGLPSNKTAGPRTLLDAESCSGPVRIDGCDGPWEGSEVQYRQNKVTVQKRWIWQFWISIGVLRGQGPVAGRRKRVKFVVPIPSGIPRIWDPRAVLLGLPKDLASDGFGRSSNRGGRPAGREPVKLIRNKWIKNRACRV